MRSTWLAPVALGVVLLVSLCGLSFHNLPLRNPGDGPSYQIPVVFSGISNLPLGGEVKLGQATVGRVRSVSTRAFQAVVRVDIEKGVRLLEGTAARLELASALSEEYVLLQPPPAAAGQLREGDTIPRESTSRRPDMESTLAGLGTMLNGSGLDQARTIVSELHTALAGREQKVRDFLHQLDAMLAVVDEHGAEFDATLNSLNKLTADTAANRPVLKAAMTDITPAVQTLLGQRERFEQLLIGVTELSRSADGVVRETGPAFTQQLEQLRPLLTELAEFDRRLGGTLDVSGTVLPLLTGTPPPVELAPPGDVGGLLSGGAR